MCMISNIIMACPTQDTRRTKRKKTNSNFHVRLWWRKHKNETTFRAKFACLVPIFQTCDMQKHIIRAHTPTDKAMNTQKSVDSMARLRHQTSSRSNQLTEIYMRAHSALSLDRCQRIRGECNALNFKLMAPAWRDEPSVFADVVCDCHIHCRRCTRIWKKKWQKYAAWKQINDKIK